jgi:predicted transcriptional regulator
VKGSPDAANHRKTMDKTMETWTRQFDRSQEELLNPESQNNPKAQRVDGSKDRMLNAAKGVPSVGNEASQFEKLNEAIQKIMEKLKETIKEFMQSFKNSKGQSNDAPGPG